MSADKKLITLAIVALVLFGGGYALFSSLEKQGTSSRPPAGQMVSPNLNLGTNTSSTVTSTASRIVILRSQTQIQWCSNGVADVWIGVTTTRLVAGFDSGSGFRVASSTAFPDSFRDYPGDIYGVTAAGTTSTIQCSRF